MNELTKRIVTEVAEQNKSKAKRNDGEFAELVRMAWWDEIISEIGVPFKERALHIFALWYPDCFEKEGDELFLKSHIASVFDIDIRLSYKIVHLLKFKIDRTPELQLDDWGDLPVRIAEPQMKMRL